MNPQETGAPDDNQPTAPPNHPVENQHSVHSPAPVATETPTSPSPLPQTEQPEQNKQQREEHHRKHGWKNVLSTIGILLLAPLLAILLTTYVFHSYEVDGMSMETTLQNQDRLIVYKLPKTWASLRGQSYTPNRGDIIVFNKAPATEFSNPVTKQLIKRVIGLPGDHVVIANGTVTVYNEQNPTGFNPDKGTDNLDEGETTTGNVDITVDDDEVFVLGDNRDNSLDSRSFGPVKLEDITGKLILRLYPFGKFQAY